MPRARLVAALLVAAAACHPHRDRATGRSEPVRADASVPIEAGEAGGAPDGASSLAPVAVDAGPATVDHVSVPKDRDAVIVRGPERAIVRALFLPGICSNATAYLQTFPEVARAHGGVLAIDGDKPCGAAAAGFRSFTWSATVQRARFDAALAAAGLEAPPDGFTLVGYSAGASIGEQMVAKWPALFPRVVLIAPPDAPKVDYLLRARGVVSMSCSLDVPARMKTAAARLNAKHVPSIYLEMPKCSHGNIADGERVFGEAFDFLDGLPADR